MPSVQPRIAPLRERLSRSNFPEYLLLAFILLSRLYNLSAMPLYWDEAYHIEHARSAFLRHAYFGVFPTGRWLNVMLIALFQPSGIESSWIARAPSVLISLLTAAGCVWLGRWLASRQVGRLALLLYGLLPFAAFFDRQAMSDPIMAAFGTLSLIGAARLSRRRNLASGVMTGAVLGLALLSKIGALFYLPMPFAAAALLPPNVQARWKALRPAFLSVVAGGAMYLAVYFAAAPETGRVSVFDPSGWCHSPQCAGRTDISENASYAAGNLKAYGEIVDRLYTIPIWIAALGAVALAKGRRLAKTLYLFVPAFLLVVPYLLTADWFPARYLTFTLAPVAVLAAFALAGCWQWLTRPLAARPLARQAGALALALVAVGPEAILTAKHLLWPTSVELAGLDDYQYSLGWRGSIPRQQVVEELLREQRATGRRINVLAWPTVNPIFYSNWGERHGIVWRLDDSTEQEAKIIPWLINGDPLYIMQDLPDYPLPSDSPDHLILEFVRTYTAPLDSARPDMFDGQPVVDLWRVVGTAEPLTSRIANDVFGDPASVSGEYAALASRLQTAPSAAVWLYPPHQFAVLRAQNGMSAMKLHPIAGSWPVDFDRVEEEMSRMSGQTAEVWVVFWNAEKGDPQRRVETWLSKMMYRAEEIWFGPLRVLRYYSEAESALLKPANAIFADMVELSGVSMSGADSRPGDVLRLALAWRCLKTTDKSYSVFTHVLDGAGNLVAQHDGTPQNGLAPTNAWAIGQQVNDLFAVALPDDLPPGDYRINVGLYDPATGERLASASGLDAVEVARFTVRP